MNCIPKDLLYSKDHEWVRLEGNMAIVGITDYAQSQLGDVVFVELPAAASQLAAGAAMAVVESVKAVSDVYAPVSGKVAAGNDKLADAPELVNQDPYGEGWIAKVELSDSAELDSLLDSAAYEQLVAEGGQ